MTSERSIARILATASVVLTAALSTAAPARAQTYDPAWPICLQIFQAYGGTYFQCEYTSMAQCQATASGRSAMCLVNPAYRGPPGPRARRPRPAYRRE